MGTMNGGSMMKVDADGDRYRRPGEREVRPCESRCEAKIVVSYDGHSTPRSSLLYGRVDNICGIISAYQGR